MPSSTGSRCGSRPTWSARARAPGARTAVRCRPRARRGGRGPRRAARSSGRSAGSSPATRARGRRWSPARLQRDDHRRLGSRSPAPAAGRRRRSPATSRPGRSARRAHRRRIDRRAGQLADERLDHRVARRRQPVHLVVPHLVDEAHVTEIGDRQVRQRVERRAQVQRGVEQRAGLGEERDRRSASCAANRTAAAPPGAP